MTEVIDFVANGGLEQPRYLTTKIWENNPDPRDNPILVDSYAFFSGPRYGYIAFFYNPKTAVWNIKSFKENDSEDPRSLRKIAELAIKENKK